MKKPLAHAIVDFRAAIADYGLPLPATVEKAMHAVDEAIKSDYPQRSLNKSMANLKRDQSFLPNLLDWLERREVQSVATSRGAYWALNAWIKSVKTMQSGAKASDAFGMNKNGRPPMEGFTRALDAAIYAEHKHRECGERLEDLLSAAATIFDARLDETKREHALARCLSDHDLAKTAEFSGLKYK